jgi:hypothetical protein
MGGQEKDSKSCKDCDRDETCAGNDSGIFPCPDFVDKVEEARRIVERYDVDFWAERGRLGIWVTDKLKDKVVFEVWDDDARQLFDDGFLKPGDELKESVLEYLKDTGVI